MFRRRSKRDRRAPATGNPHEYDEAARDRLRSIAESGGYAFNDEDRTDVEARIRRMFYGAKVEGSKAEPEEDDDPQKADPSP